MRRVLIFRKNMLPYSETFIADQGSNLVDFESFYVGFDSDPSGSCLLGDSQQIVLSEYAAFPVVRKWLFRHGLQRHSNWFNAIRQVNPVLIHAHFLKDGLDAMRIADDLGIPLVVTAHGHDITKYAVSKPRKDLAKIVTLFHRANKVIAVSDYIRQKLVDAGCPDGKIQKHYIGINTERFDVDKQESAEPLIVFVGRLVEKKGCQYLLQALLKLNKYKPRLLVIGEGPLKSHLMQYAKENAINAEFLGRKKPDEIKEIMRSAWIFSVPSITANDGDAEGLGMVFLEAQAMQTPVVSFASGGVVEAVAHGSSGLLCAEKDVESLANNIEYLLNNQQVRKSFGEYGRQRVREKFDIHKQCLELENIYGSLLRDTA